MRTNGFMVNRLFGLKPTLSKPRGTGLKTGSPICPAHRCHCKFVGRVWNHAWRRNLPTWGCPVKGCSHTSQRIDPR